MKELLGNTRTIAIYEVEWPLNSLSPINGDGPIGSRRKNKKNPLSFVGKNGWVAEKEVKKLGAKVIHLMLASRNLKAS